MFNIIMPVAGLGSRFRSGGHVVPKPIIMVEGRPMAFWAFLSLASQLPGCRPVLVVLREHVEAFRIDEVLGEHIPSAHIAVAETLTGGSLETCLLARDAVARGGGMNKPVIVLDGDLVFRSQPFVDEIRNMRDGAEAADGALLSFRASDPRYSYAEVLDGRVLRTAEKVAISDRALVGAYAFRRAETFFSIADEIVADNERVANGEFYCSNAYNRLIRRGGRVALADIEAYWSMGTPEELAASLADPAFVALLRDFASAPAPG